MAVLTYKALHNAAPRYLGPLVRVADIPGRRALLCAVTDRLAVPSVRLHTVSNRAFRLPPRRSGTVLPDDIVGYLLHLHLLPNAENFFV